MSVNFDNISMTDFVVLWTVRDDWNYGSFHETSWSYKDIYEANEKYNSLCKFAGEHDDLCYRVVLYKCYCEHLKTPLKMKGNFNPYVSKYMLYRKSK
ncbi:MAG: hypothetical protein MJ232_04625 [archaeon]|nr:hypothetical protein [archaeon]